MSLEFFSKSSYLPCTTDDKRIYPRQWTRRHLRKDLSESDIGLGDHSEDERFGVSLSQGVK